MIDRLDRYVARYFVGAWFASVVFFLGLFSVYDFFSNVDELVDQVGTGKVFGVGDVLWLYVLQTPAIMLQVAPFIMVSAALVTLMQLQRHNEFSAMVLVGRSPRRVLRAIVLLTVVFVALLVWVQEGVSPSVARARQDLRAQLMGDDDESRIDLVQLIDAEGQLVVAHGYDVLTGVVARMQSSYTDDDGRDVVISGSNARWAEGAGGWLLEQGTSTVVTADSRIVGEAPFLRTDVRPEDLQAQVASPFDLSYGRILERSERYPKNRSYRWLRHYHFTFPLGVLAVVLLVLPFVIDPSPAGRLKGLGIAILCVLGYFVLGLGLQQLGRDGTVQPVIAAWLPVILCGSLVVVLFDGLE
ncbi:MAG: LptF/LptG family permease [Planctomycetes bacterium]|nr:LptF/LptG family permease [Planctomycetota bacterium]